MLAAPHEMPDDVMTTGQAANLVRVRPSTVYRWALAGKVPSWRRNGRLLVSRADVQALVERTATAAPAPEPVKERRARKDWTERVLRKWGATK